MATLSEVVSFLDRELDTESIPDYPFAYNGLQLESRGEVKRVVCAVDASLSVIREAVELGADLLIVHHGIFWQGLQAVTGPVYEKYRVAIEGSLAIYSSHVPLDIHEKLGNNRILAEKLGLEEIEAFHPWKGILLGLKGVSAMTFGELSLRIEDVLGSPVLSTGDVGECAGRVGLITGGAGSEVSVIAAEGIDTFISGEGPHWSFPLADELGLKVIYGGHYATETYGVQALLGLLESAFRVEGSFIDQPTGL